MRTEFVTTDSARDAIAQCPWSEIVARVPDRFGYLCFESSDDYERWRIAPAETDA